MDYLLQQTRCSGARVLFWVVNSLCKAKKRRERKKSTIQKPKYSKAQFVTACDIAVMGNDPLVFNLAHHVPSVNRLMGFFSFLFAFMATSKTSHIHSACNMILVMIDVIWHHLHTIIAFLPAAIRGFWRAFWSSEHKRNWSKHPLMRMIRTSLCEKVIELCRGTVRDELALHRTEKESSGLPFSRPRRKGHKPRKKPSRGRNERLHYVEHHLMSS